MMMKQRETRQTMLVPVRVRQEANWADGRIRNVSSRGVMLQMNNPPPTGTYLEIRRGDIVIIGQVRWSRNDRCGLRTQDKIPIDRLKLNRPSAPRVSDGQAEWVERRVTVRELSPAEAAERNRMRGRLLQTASLVAAGVLGAWLVGTLVYEVMQRPVQAIVDRL